MNRSFLLEASLCLCVMLSTVACGRRVAAASAGDGDTGAHPATVEPDMDANNFTGGPSGAVSTGESR